MPSFQYVGTRPEHIVGVPPGDISESEYDNLSWELQQAVLINKGSNGGPLYQERPSRQDRKRVRDLMGPDPEDTDDGVDDGSTPAPADTTAVAAPTEAPAPTDLNPPAQVEQPPATPDQPVETPPA